MCAVDCTSCTYTHTAICRACLPLALPPRASAQRCQSRVPANPQEGTVLITQLRPSMEGCPATPSWCRERSLQHIAFQIMKCRSLTWNAIEVHILPCNPVPSASHAQATSALKGMPCWANVACRCMVASWLCTLRMFVSSNARALTHIEPIRMCACFQPI